MRPARPAFLSPSPTAQMDSLDVQAPITGQPLVARVDGHWYLEAWCRNAEGVRLFRLDRIDDVAVLEEPAAPPPQAHERDLDDGLYQPGADEPLVRLRLARTARWVADYYPVEEQTEVTDPPGGLAVTVRTSDLSWARRLVALLDTWVERVVHEALALGESPR